MKKYLCLLTLCGMFQHISSDELDLAAQALSTIQAPTKTVNKLQMKLQHPAIQEKFERLIDIEFRLFNSSNKSDTDIKKEWETDYCTKLKNLKQHLIDAMNDSQFKVLPLSLDETILQPVEVELDKNNIREWSQSIDIIEIPEGTIVTINTLLTELECEKYAPLVAGDYELGPELVKQKLATDITNDMKKKFSTLDITQNKFYEIKMQQQKGAECSYCSITSSIYMLYALTKANANDAITIMNAHLCIGGSCPFSKLQKVSSSLFQFPHNWLETDFTDILLHAIPYQKQLQSVFKDIDAQALENIIKNIFTAIGVFHSQGKLNHNRFTPLEFDAYTISLANPHLYDENTIIASLNFSDTTVMIPNLISRGDNFETFIKKWWLWNQKPPFSIAILITANLHNYAVVCHKTMSTTEYFLLDTLYSLNSKHLDSLRFLQTFVQNNPLQIIELNLYKLNPGSTAANKKNFIYSHPTRSTHLDYLIKTTLDSSALFANEPKLKQALEQIL